MILYVIGGLLLLVVLLLLYPRVFPWLFGAYYCTGYVGRMPFWTRHRAERYRAHSIDPYARGLQGEIVFRPGVLSRKEER